MRAQASVEFLLGLVFLLASASIFISSVERQNSALSSSVLLAQEAKVRALQNLAADELAIFGRHILLQKNVTAAPGAGFVQNATQVGGKIAVEIDEHEPL